MPIIDFDRLEQFVVLANSPSVSAAAADALAIAAGAEPKHHGLGK